MLRLKLDLSAFLISEGPSPSPVWRFEPLGIQQATVGEYASVVLSKHGILDHVPDVFLDGALIKNNESSSIIRDGDLLVFRPQKSRRLTEDGKAMIVHPFVRCENASEPLERPMGLRQHKIRTVSTEADVSLADSVVVVTDDNNEEDEAEEATVLNASTGESSRKRRKRGPRNRVRTKRKTFDDGLQDHSSVELEENGQDKRKWNESSPSLPRRFAVTVPPIQQSEKCVNSPKTFPSLNGISNKELPRPSSEAADNDVVATSPPNSVTQNANESSSHSALNLPAKSVGRNKTNAAKISTRKMAKRAFGIGDLVGMLRTNESESVESQMVKANDDQKQDDRSRTADRDGGDGSEVKQTMNGDVDFNKDVVVGSCLHTGAILFSEDHLCAKHYSDLTLKVVRKLSSTKQLYVKHLRGDLPRELRGSEFKVDWTMLTHVNLVEDVQVKEM